MKNPKARIVLCTSFRGWSVGLSIGRVAGRFECGQIALVMRQQGAEYAVADIESVAIFIFFLFLSMFMFEEFWRFKPVSRAAHAHKCAATARLCSHAVTQAVVGGLVVTFPTLNATLERVYVTFSSLCTQIYIFNHLVTSTNKKKQRLSRLSKVGCIKHANLSRNDRTDHCGWRCQVIAPHGGPTRRQGEATILTFCFFHLVFSPCEMMWLRRIFKIIISQ